MSGVTKEEVKEIVDGSVSGALAKFAADIVPGGDLEPHREFHQAKINAAKAEQEAWESRKKVYDALLAKVLDKGLDGVFGALRIVVLLGLVGFAAKMGFMLPSGLVELLK